MFKISTLRRITASLIVAGIAVGATSAAKAEGEFDNLMPTPKRAAPPNNLPGFDNPMKPTFNAAQVFVGTWKVALKNGKHIAVRFHANGRFMLIHSDRKKVVEVGFWKIAQGKLVMLPVGVCAKADMKRCRKFEQRKLVHVQFRIINRNRVVAPSGVFTRHV